MPDRDKDTPSLPASASAEEPSLPQAHRAHRAQELRVGGRPYVLVPKPDFERLLMEADLPPPDAPALAAEPGGRDLPRRRHAGHPTLAPVPERAGIPQEAAPAPQHE